MTSPVMTVNIYMPNCWAVCATSPIDIILPEEYRKYRDISEIHEQSSEKLEIFNALTVSCMNDLTIQWHGQGQERVEVRVVANICINIMYGAFSSGSNQ